MAQMTLSDLLLIVSIGYVRFDVSMSQTTMYCSPYSIGAVSDLTSDICLVFPDSTNNAPSLGDVQLCNYDLSTSLSPDQWTKGAEICAQNGSCARYGNWWWSRVSANVEADTNAFTTNISTTVKVSYNNGNCLKYSVVISDLFVSQQSNMNPYVCVPDTLSQCPKYDQLTTADNSVISGIIGIGVGVGVGAILLMALLVVLLVCCIKRRKRVQEPTGAIKSAIISNTYETLHRSTVPADTAKIYTSFVMPGINEANYYNVEKPQPNQPSIGNDEYEEDGPV